MGDKIKNPDSWNGIIPIGDNSYVVTTNLYYAIAEKRVYTKGKKIGEEYWYLTHYFSTLEALYKGILEVKVKLYPDALSNLETLIRLKNEISELEVVKREND